VPTVFNLKEPVELVPIATLPALVSRIFSRLEALNIKLLPSNLNAESEAPEPEIKDGASPK